MVRAAVALVLLGSLAIGPAVVAAQGSKSSIAPGGPDLKATLEKGLKARRPQEFSFIQLVVNRVDDGSLPQPLVESTFLWARKQRPYPYVYFERGLKVRAKQLGISL